MCLPVSVHVFVHSTCVCHLVHCCRTGALRVGDCLVAINGVSLAGRSMSDVLQLLQHAGDTVVLKVNKRLRSKHCEWCTQAYRRTDTTPARSLRLCGTHAVTL